MEKRIFEKFKAMYKSYHGKETSQVFNKANSRKYFLYIMSLSELGVQIPKH